MKAMWLVFSKEFLDIVRDRRRFIWMLVSSFILFPLLFVSPYALILGRITKQTTEILTVPVQGIENAPALVAYLTDEKSIRCIPATDVESLVLSKKYSVGMIIPADYESKLETGQTADLTVVADLRRQVDVTSSRLGMALQDYNSMLVEQRLDTHGLTDEFVTPIAIKQQNAATATETTGSLIGLIIPGIIISLSLSSGMPVAVSSIAGEKKKLTLEPVLFTTVSRFQLVFAKLMAVLASVAINLLTMMVSLGISAVVIGIVIYRSLPKDLSSLANASNSTGGTSPYSELITAGYKIQPLAILLFLFAPALIVLLGAALQLLISAWARNDEEAYTYLTPLSFLSGLVVVVAFFLDEFTPKLWHYALPIFGTILSMRDLLSNKIDPASLTVMFVSSSLYAFLMLGLAVWMFHREEVVFRT